MDKLILKRGREKSLRRRHPWIFSGAVARVTGTLRPGDTVEVHSASGDFLALAAYSPKSQITARVWSWERQEIDAGFLRERVRRAVLARRAFIDPNTTDAMRLIHGIGRVRINERASRQHSPADPLAQKACINFLPLPGPHSCGDL